MCTTSIRGSRVPVTGGWHRDRGLPAAILTLALDAKTFESANCNVVGWFSSRDKAAQRTRTRLCREAATISLCLTSPGASARQRPSGARKSNKQLAELRQTFVNLYERFALCKKPERA